jgi:hypothetical protein
MSSQGSSSRSEMERGERCSAAALKLLNYCKANDWAGYDPYDALNSKIFQALPFLDARWPRLVLTQALKRSPVNLRPLLLIPKTQNPKAIGLFLSAILKLESAGRVNDDGLVRFLIERLAALRSQDVPYWCWGYSFPWQMRQKVVPRGAANLVCTTFSASALMDAYEQRRDSQCLTMAASAADYILNELYWSEGDRVAGFAYPLRTIRVQVYNANFLAAALLCRVARHTGEKKFLEPALKAARFSAARQSADGSWDYGDAPTQKWIDNFHTGFNLSALQTIARCAGTEEFDPCLRRGFEFYRANFFRADGAAKYFHNRTYPIDIHAVAQSILTLLDFRAFDPGAAPLAHSVFDWAMNHLWDERGFFYYRVLRSCTIRTSYMRWSQAWMLRAIAALLSEPGAAAKPGPGGVAPAFVEAR